MSNSDQTKLLAQALYEIRLLLSGYIGSTVEADMAVRVSAHLAYALHNEALAVVEGKSFDMSMAVAKIKAADKILGSNLLERVVAEAAQRG